MQEGDSSCATGLTANARRRWTTPSSLPVPLKVETEFDLFKRQENETIKVENDFKV